MAEKFTLSGCMSSRKYRPRYCGMCTDKRCCIPNRSKVVKVEFKCMGGASVQWKMQWITSCVCERKCNNPGDMFSQLHLLWLTHTHTINITPAVTHLTSSLVLINNVNIPVCTCLVSWQDTVLQRWISVWCDDGSDSGSVFSKSQDYYYYYYCSFYLPFILMIKVIREWLSMCCDIIFNSSNTHTQKHHWLMYRIYTYNIIKHYWPISNTLLSEKYLHTNIYNINKEINL